jgi:hypothetical protein
LHLIHQYYLEKDLREVYFPHRLLHLDKVMILKLHPHHLIHQYYLVFDQMIQKHHQHHLLLM